MKKNDFDILIVDDEIEYTKSFRKIIDLEGYTVTTASSGDEALSKLNFKHYHLVITDLMMEGMNGIQLIESIHEFYPKTQVILMTAYATIENAIEAMKKGAFSYYVKGNDPEELMTDIHKVYESTTDEPNTINRITSKNHTFSEMLKKVDKAANSHANILLLGESGVGKDVLANYIHQVSTRTEHAFVAINCHAFQETVLESELFGHKKGAFTGANEDRIGRFEIADGGTMFLDEIADTSLSTQSKLLRVLDSKKYERLGSNETMYSNFRLISATNKDLKQMIEDGTFREDFYYRISTVIFEIPPLRERREDIPELIDLFCKKSCDDLGVDPVKLDKESIETLSQYYFPGNIRELKNLIERLVIFAENGLITIRDLPDHITSKGILPDTLKERRRILEKEHIEKILKENSYKMEQSAQVLGITRRQLTNKVSEYNIKKP